MHVLFVAVFSLAALLGAIGISGAIGRRFHKARAELPPGAGPAERPENVRRLLKHLVRSPIASLADGTAAVIHGRVAGEPTLRAPLSGSPCLGFHVWIRGGGVDRTLLHDRASCTDFTLRDASGAIRVRAAGLELAITRAEATAYTLPFPPWLVALLPPTIGSPVVEVCEGLLRPGDEVLVCGVTSIERGVDDNYRDGERVTTSLQATPTFPLVASTDVDLLAQGDRPIDPAELPRS